MSKENKPTERHWLVKLLCGTYGYNGVDFFEIIRLSNENEKRAKERDAYFRRHGLRK